MPCLALHLAVQVQVQRVFNYNFPLEEDHYECAYVLTHHGIDIEMLNRQGDSALDLVEEDFAQLLECEYKSYFDHTNNSFRYPKEFFFNVKTLIICSGS